MKSFKAFISEAKREQKDPCYAAFEKQVFGDILNSKERDTSKEKEIWDKVSANINGGREHTGIAAAYRELIKCKGSYDVLKPSVKTLYRGLAVSVSVAMKLVNWSSAQTKKTIAGKVMVGHKTTYTPKFSVESWSANPNVSFRFASGQASGMDTLYTLKINHLTTIVKRIKGVADTYSRYKIKAEEATTKSAKQKAKDQMWYMKDTISHMVREINEQHFTNNAIIPVLYTITPDADCVMNPTFSNKLSLRLLGSSEHEVTRINRNPVEAMVWAPADILEASRIMKELQAYLKDKGIPFPATKLALPTK